MALAMGDEKFAEQCRKWFDQGHWAMEEYLWTGKYYRNYNAPGLKERLRARTEKEIELVGVKVNTEQVPEVSDVLMAYSLDGEWVGRIHGLRILSDERFRSVLRSVKELCLDDVTGLMPFVEPDGTPSFYIANWYYRLAMPWAIIPEENLMAGMAFIYGGDRKTGLKIIHDTWYDQACRYGYPWDLCNLLMPYSGKRACGTEYNHNMVIWTVPAALKGQDLKTLCAPGGLVDKVLKAARNG
jgi:uncharacterized protein (DUF608 family)